MKLSELIEELVKNGIARLPRHAHEIDIKIRDDGVDRYQEGDWLLHLPAYIAAATQAAAERARVEADKRFEYALGPDVCDWRCITARALGVAHMEKCVADRELKVGARKRWAELAGPGEVRDAL